MVPIFFVISGYVLTAKGLLYIRSKRHEALIRSTSSSAFRRLFRVWLPVLVFTLVNALLTRWFGKGVVGKVFGIHIQATLGAQLKDWLFQMNRLANPFFLRSSPALRLNEYAKTSWTLRKPCFFRWLRCCR